MFLEHQMISEGSCDTENWSNDANVTVFSKHICIIVKCYF